MWKTAVIWAALAIASGHAYGYAITGTGDFDTFSWSTSGAGYTLAGNGSINVANFSSSSLTLDVTLSNTTITTSADPTDTAGQNARLVSWGFGIDPEVTSVAFFDVADGGMNNAGLASLPSLKEIDVCAFGGSNCSAVNAGGILGNGHSDAFRLIIGGDFGSEVTLDPLGFRYKTNQGTCTFSVDTATGLEGPCGTTDGAIRPASIPEPGTLLLLGTSFLAAGIIRRRSGKPKTVARVLSLKCHVLALNCFCAHG